MQSFAEALIPPALTAPRMKGTVALEVPPISTGFRPSSAQMGAARREVYRPRIGGRPIREAMASPYGSAIRAAIAPPNRSPRNNCPLYLGLLKRTPDV